jgi:hypothetical protein
VLYLWQGGQAIGTGHSESGCIGRAYGKKSVPGGREGKGVGAEALGGAKWGLEALGAASCSSSFACCCSPASLSSCPISFALAVKYSCSVLNRKLSGGN